jgi:hypothetical protein
MQYILTEEEYNALKKRQYHEIAASRDQLQALCTKIAVTMPISVDWRKGQDQPWGCILSEITDSGYCDDCPVQTICPNEDKEWSQ